MTRFNYRGTIPVDTSSSGSEAVKVKAMHIGNKLHINLHIEKMSIIVKHVLLLIGTPGIRYVSGSEQFDCKPLVMKGLMVGSVNEPSSSSR